MYRWNVSTKGRLFMSADSLFLYFLHAFCQTKKNKITANVNPILDKKNTINHILEKVDVPQCLPPAQLTFTCSKSTIETLDKRMKHVQN